LTIPYYLSELYQKLPLQTPSERGPLIANSRKLAELYLNTCIKYEILSKEHITAYEREAEPDAGTLRNEKIARIKQIKSLNESLQKKMKEKIARKDCRLMMMKRRATERASFFLFIFVLLKRLTRFVSSKKKRRYWST